LKSLTKEPTYLVRLTRAQIDLLREHGIAIDLRLVKPQGADNVLFKKEQAEEVVKLIAGGVTVSEVSKLIGTSHQRVSQIYKKATGRTIRENQGILKLQELRNKERDILRHRTKVCKGCNITFVAVPMRKYHSAQCREEHKQLTQTQRPAYKKRLVRNRINPSASSSEI